METTFSYNFSKTITHVFLAVSVCCLLCCAGTAQNSQATRQAKQPLLALEGKYQLFAADNLQNIYVLTATNEVVKYTPDGKEQFRYPNSTLGSIKTIDVSNPLLIMVFFPDYQNVLLLDRTLSPAGQFNLFRAGLLQVTAVGMANDNHLWAYDATTFQLKKIDREGTVLFESTDLSLELGRSISPVKIFEKNQTVFLCDPKEGILLFDTFGKYLKTLHLKGISNCQVLGDELYYLEKGQLVSFNLQSLTSKSYVLPEGLHNPTQVEIVADKLYVLDSEGVKCFALE